MTSPIDLCNRALSLIGARSTISSFSEGSAEAINCNLWYDTLRKQLLRGAPWGFARAQAPLSMLGDLGHGTSQYPWPYKYSYPSDAIKIRYIIPGQVSQSPIVPTTGSLQPVGFTGPSRANRFLINSDPTGRVILSNVANALVIYTMNQIDPAMFDDLFAEALVQALSAHLVIPLSGNAAMRPQFIQSAMGALNEARAADGNEAVPSTDHTPDWIAARGPVPMTPLDVFGLGSWYSGFDNVTWGM